MSARAPTRTAYVVGHFKNDCLVDAGIYSEPFPTVVMTKTRPYVLSAVSGKDFEQAHRRAKPTLSFLLKMIRLAPARRTG